MADSSVALALFEPDIPQNTGTLIRLAACLGVPLHLIEPFGFIWDDARVKRATMDYVDLAQLSRHESWDDFGRWRPAGRRLVLLTTLADTSHVDFAFQPDDILLLGRESSGVPHTVHSAVDARIKVPMIASARSLNVAVAGALVLGEALRQTQQFPATAG